MEIPIQYHCNIPTICQQDAFSNIGNGAPFPPMATLFALVTIVKISVYNYEPPLLYCEQNLPNQVQLEQLCGPSDGSEDNDGETATCT